MMVALVCAGCGGTPQHATTPRAPSQVVAVLPAAWVTSAPTTPVDASREVGRALEHERRLRVVPAGAALAAESDPTACRDDVECLRRVGRRAGASTVVGIKLAELGDTVVLRLSVLDASAGSQQTTLQRVVRGASADRVSRALAAMGSEARERLAPAPRAVREAGGVGWWVWAGAGALAIAGAAVVVGVAVSSGDDQSDPDGVIVPP